MAVRRKGRISTPAIGTQDEYHALIATWMLRMLLGSDAAFRGFFDVKRGFYDSDVSDFLNLQDVDDDKIKVKELKEIMRTQLNQCEKRVSTSSILFSNISLMVKRLSITPLQQQVLAFSVLWERYERLQDCLRLFSIPTEALLYISLSHALGASADEVKKALSRSSPLRASGLIKIETENCRHRGNIELVPMDGLSEALLVDNHDEKALMRHFLAQAKSATLHVADYPHVRKDIDILNDLLKVALRQRDKGVNILLYGPPGTGKTELVRLLAKQLNASLSIPIQTGR